MNDPLGKKHRRSIRLQDYDYSTNGLYFVTICVNKRLELFGDIIDGKMILNDAGKMVDEFWNKLPEKYENVYIDEHVIMPNHFHGILGIDNDNENGQTYKGRHTGLPLQKCDVGVEPCFNPINGFNPIQGLPRFVSWFKRMTTNRYIKNVHENNWEPFHQKLWQRNYYEHIIRNEKELEKTRYYITANPEKWIDDKYNSINDKNVGATHCGRPNNRDEINMGGDSAPSLRECKYAGKMVNE